MTKDIEKKAENTDGQIEEEAQELGTEDEIIAGEGDDAANDDDDPDQTKGDDETDDDPFEIDLTPASPADDEIEDNAATPLVKDLREQLKTAAKERRELKELKAKIEAEKKASVEKQLPELGAKPKLEDFDYDDDEYEKAILDWHERKKAHDAEAAEVEKKAQSLQEAYDNRLNKYYAEKETLAVDDMEDADAAVKSALSKARQSYLITAGKGSAKFILALGRDPKRLARLAAIKDDVEFIAEAAILSAQLKDKTMKPQTKPEKRVKSSGGGALSGNDAKELERLEKEADRTGDRSAIQRFNRERQKAS